MAEIENAHDDAITQLDFDAEGGLLASASQNYGAKLWAIAGDDELAPQQAIINQDNSVYAVMSRPMAGRWSPETLTVGSACSGSMPRTEGGNSSMRTRVR